MAEPGYVFTTIAMEFKTNGGYSSGFFCLWDDQLTFVHSNWVQFVNLLPLMGSLVPNSVKPTGPEDERTRFRIAYRDLTQVTKEKGKIRGGKIRIHNPDGTYRDFSGGSLNRAFTFEAAATEITKALDAAGYSVNVADDVLSVQHSAG